MPNKWTEFVKDWASKNNMSYSCAMSKQECKDAYRAANPIPSKSTKRRKNLKKVGLDPYKDLDKQEVTAAEKKKLPPQLKKAIEMSKVNKEIKQKKKSIVKDVPFEKLEEAFPDTTIKQKNVTIKKKEAKKSTPAQKVFDIKPLKDIIESYLPKIDKSKLDDLVENIKNDFSYWERILSHIGDTDYEEAMDLRYKTTKQKTKVMKEANDTSKFISVAQSLLEDRLKWLAEKSDLEVDEDELFYDNLDTTDYFRVVGYGQYVLYDYALENIKDIQSTTITNYINMMEEMGIDEVEARKILNKRFEREGINWRVNEEPKTKKIAEAKKKAEEEAKKKAEEEAKKKAEEESKKKAEESNIKGHLKMPGERLALKKAKIGDDEFFISEKDKFGYRLMVSLDKKPYGVYVPEKEEWYIKGDLTKQGAYEEFGREAAERYSDYGFIDWDDDDEEVEGTGLSKACWKGYEAIGMKKKGKKMVPNCVPMKGGSIADWVSPTAWKDYGTAVVKGRNDYPPKMREIIAKYGKVTILKMYACRTPVPSLLTSALNAVSLGAFNKKWENQPYDKLFHLDLRIELATRPQTTILLEKNEVLNSIVNPKPPGKDTECNLIPKNKRITILQLLEGAKQIQGDKFFKYSAYNNNCQDFIMALLKGSGLGTQENYDFIKQDTKELFRGLPGTRKFANTITDLGAVVDTVIQGAGVERKIKGKGIPQNIYELFHFIPPQNLVPFLAAIGVSVGGIALFLHIIGRELHEFQGIPNIIRMELADRRRIAQDIAENNDLNDNQIRQIQNVAIDLESASEDSSTHSSNSLNSSNSSNPSSSLHSSDFDLSLDSMEDDTRFPSPVTTSTDESGKGIHKGENYYVQSVVFDKDKFDVKEARKWLKDNNYVSKKPDITETQIRFRQVNPKYIEKMGFKRFRTKKIGRKSGISLIISYK